MKPSPKRRQVLAGLSLAPVVYSLPSWAQSAPWPSKPIKLLVGFPPGGGADAMGRLVGAKLGERLGQPVIIDNKTGATGTICSDIVAKSPPDGYTLQVAHINSNAIGPLMVAKGKFHPVDDFTPIALIGITPQMLCHHPKHKFANVKAMIDYCKANPGKLTFASSGVGSIQHIAGEDFKLRAGVDMLHVPFKGTGEAMAALLSGDVDCTFSSTGSAVPQVKGGKLVLLAVCSPKRLPDYPNVPAVAETLPGYEIATWYGLAGPKNLPKPIVDRLYNEVQAILRMPDVVKRFDDLDAKVTAGGPKEFGDFWRSEVKRYQKLIDDAKITA
ncbi:MAG TPA: tripartite tricarboxylate transporter substrate binding protein [Usitatibacter sp.]|nr:tripartite tricarboxylate transporter substrate binding protein [Usitatibacter sp.]